ncbi:DUF4209 domain-containing protein [Pedobacter insulae]|uniref:DUF4209 domain-containing protein n=1 Tax=Pedobacter insulae TaxID=414048 RepID=A0A1I2Z829_9SPHI|nr:DUF4209 domain-containing protein [Pedobacter insulae]SFH33656.1 protein of unknown function [Pedobacter insulae]
MRSTKIDIKDVCTIEDLSTILEKKALLMTRNWDITDVLVAYRNQAITDEEKQWAQWELECFLFTIRGNSVFSYSYSTGQNVGEVRQFPELDTYQQDAFAYLKKRAAEAKNPLLAARYNHLLWKAPKGVKSKTHAEAAVKAYLVLIQEFIDLFDQDSDGENYAQVSQKFENLIELVAEVKIHIQELKDLINRVLYNIQSVPFYVKHSLLKHMLESSTIFKPVDFENALSVFELALSEENGKSDSFLWIHNYFDTAIAIARKTGSDIKIWFNLLGDMHASIAKAEVKPDRMWLKLKSFASAVEAYQNAGNNFRKKEIEQLIFELKPQVQLPTVRLKKSEQEIEAFNIVSRYIKNECEQLLQEPPEVIYAHLISGWFFPSKETIAKQTAKVKSSLDFFTVIQFDRNKNIRNQKNDVSKNKQFYEGYQSYLSHITLQYLHMTFIPGIKSGRLTFKNFIAFLAENTWLGKPYLKTDLGGDQLEINWLTLISPAICDYFMQVQSWALSQDSSYTPNFILCIDSLTLKMEGLFRNFAERLNVSTTIGGKKGTQEAYVNHVLDHEIIQQYFDADDIQFFKYLFANEGGMNLRNNVAHCFYNFLDYNLDKMHLLLAALIRLAKYDVTEDIGGCSSPN